MDDLTTEVPVEASSDQVESTTDSSPAVTPDEAQTTQAPAEESAAPPLYPENDDDLKGQETNPHVQAVINLRGALRERDQQYAPWKDVIDQYGDPTIAKDYHELLTMLHTPVEGQPDSFNTKPFIEKLDSMSPGTANQMFFDLLTYKLPDEHGRVDTMQRHMIRSMGLDPDRLDDYANIDTVRASGVVTTDDLAGIPERLHDAFRALSQAQRDDIMLQRQTDTFGKVQYSAATLDYLNDKAEALEARQWREKDEAAKREQAEREQQAFEQRLQETIIQDVTTEAQSIRDSVLQKSLSQVTFSSDAVQDRLAKEGIMALLAQVQSPYPYQQQAAMSVLKDAGIELNGFSELLNRFEERRVAYKRYEAMGDQLRARQALSEYSVVKQQVLAKANDYALRLAKANGQRVAATASQQNGQLAAATSRYVPSGSQVQGQDSNPYANNPHPVGTPAYHKYVRDLDKQYGVTGASMFGS